MTLRGNAAQKAARTRAMDKRKREDLLRATLKEARSIIRDQRKNEIDNGTVMRSDGSHRAADLDPDSIEKLMVDRYDKALAMIHDCLWALGVHK